MEFYEDLLFQMRNILEGLDISCGGATAILWSGLEPELIKLNSDYDCFCYLNVNLTYVNIKYLHV